MNTFFDAIIVGLGAMGSATAYQLARRGARVLGIDQFRPPHTLGSSHGGSRITRLAIGEGDEYVPLALRSHEIWRELEGETGRELMVTTGGLMMTSIEGAVHHGANFFRQTVEAAGRHGIGHELLDADEIARRYPQFRLRGTEQGYFEYDAGFLRPEACVEAQIDVASRLGATLLFGERVLAFEAGANGVAVTTSESRYAASRLILAAGPWLAGLLVDAHPSPLPEGEGVRWHTLGSLFSVYRQVMYWFTPEMPSSFDATRLPVFIWQQGLAADEMMYGFPADGTGGVKLASESYVAPVTPDVSRAVGPGETAAFQERYVAPNFSGLISRAVRAETCLYAVTPDYRFVIDRHPAHDNVFVVSPCSGHGFKHSAAIGEVMAQLVVDGRSEIDISPFSLSRFGV
jgi:sarcosine oxidase